MAATTKATNKRLKRLKNQKTRSKKRLITRRKNYTILLKPILYT